MEKRIYKANNDFSYDSLAVYVASNRIEAIMNPSALELTLTIHDEKKDKALGNIIDLNMLDFRIEPVDEHNLDAPELEELKEKIEGLREKNDKYFDYWQEAEGNLKKMTER